MPLSDKMKLALHGTAASVSVLLLGAVSPSHISAFHCQPPTAAGIHSSTIQPEFVPADLLLDLENPNLERCHEPLCEGPSCVEDACCGPKPGPGASHVSLPLARLAGEEAEWESASHNGGGGGGGDSQVSHGHSHGHGGGEAGGGSHGHGHSHGADASHVSVVVDSA